MKAMESYNLQEIEEEAPFLQLEERSDENEPINDPPGDKQFSMMYKMMKTFCVILIWFCMGLWSEINGATFQDLMSLTNSNYGALSQAISMKGVGGLCGCFLGGGYIVERLHHKIELILVVCVMISAGLNSVIPFCHYVVVYGIINAILGWADVLLNVAGQVIIMDIWKEKASGPLHSVHIGYGVGGFIVPQIVKPFISKKLPVNEKTITNSDCEVVTTPPFTNFTFDVINGNDSTLSNVTINPRASSLSETSNLKYGFFIITAIVIVIAFIWLLFYLFKNKLDKVSNNHHKKKSKRSIRDTFNFNVCAPGDPIFAFFIYVLLFLWCYMATSGERIIGKYLYSYARNQACFSPSKAENLLTAYWVFHTVGRTLGFLVSSLIHMKYVIFIEGVGNLISALVLFFYSDNHTALWLFVSCLGLFTGPIYPSGVAWTNRYIILTATGVMIPSIASGISDISFLPTFGHFVEILGIRVMTVFLLGYGIIICVLPIIMQSVACTRGDRFMKQNFNENLHRM